MIQGTGSRVQYELSGDGKGGWRIRDQGCGPAGNAGAVGEPSSTARESCGARLSQVLHHFCGSRRLWGSTMIIVHFAQQLPYSCSKFCRTLARRGDTYMHYSMRPALILFFLG